MRSKTRSNKRAEKKPRNVFKLLLVILAGMILFIIVLFIAAFRMLQWAQDYGLVDVPAEAVTIEEIGDIEIGPGGIEVGGIAQDPADMSGNEYQPESAIESIQMEYFMEES